MATLTSDRAKSTFPVFAASGAGVLCAAYGTYELTANPTAADVIEFCRIPGGSKVIGGWLVGDDIDTGTEALDIDIGWAANGVEAADPDGFGNLGVLTGDAFAAGNLSMPAGLFYLLMGTTGSKLFDGVVSFTNETTIIGTVNAPANAGGTGTLTLVILYVCS